MNRIIIITAIASLSLVIGSCGLPFVGVEYVVHGVKKATRSKSPDPESKWNRAKRWRRISENPPTYIPRNYSLTAARTPVTGDWLVDQRDGKRLFVPKGDVVSKADARVITTKNVNAEHIRFDGQSGGENLLNVFPPMM